MGKVDVTITQGAQSDTLDEAFEYVAAANTPDLSIASLDAGVLDVGAEASNAEGSSFNHDGTKMFVIDSDSDLVYQYSLGTVWRVDGTNSYDSLTLDPQEFQPKGVTINNDGTSLFTVGDASEFVREFELTTAGTLAAGSSLVASLNLSGIADFARGVALNPDADRLFVIDTSDNGIHEWLLTTPGTLVDGSTYVDFLDISAQVNTVGGFEFSPDGTKIYVLSTSPETIYQYTLTTAGKVSDGATYDGVSFSGGNLSWTPSDIMFSDDGEKMFITDSQRNSVEQYSV